MPPSVARPAITRNRTHTCVHTYRQRDLVINVCIYIDVYVHMSSIYLYKFVYECMYVCIDILRKARSLPKGFHKRFLRSMFV